MVVTEHGQLMHSHGSKRMVSPPNPSTRPTRVKRVLVVNKRETTRSPEQITFHKKSSKIIPNIYSDLKNAVVRQPISVVIDASKWQFYKFGVFDGCPDGSDIDHAVLLVGYDAEAWIVKNSWGSKWGDGGYIRLKMGNQCGILNEATYPFL